MIRKNITENKNDPKKAIELTNNLQYNAFADANFRNAETKRLISNMGNRVGQSEKAVLPISQLANGPVMLYQNSITEKDPLERKKFIADKMVEECHLKLKQRIISYRNMLSCPEVDEIVDNVTNEAIVNDGRGQIVSLGVNDHYPGIAIGDQTKEKLQQDFNNLMQTVFCFNDVARDVFKKFLTEGAQFWEVVYNKEMNKIVGVNHLPSYNMLVIVDRGEVVGYRQILDNEYGGVTLNLSSVNQGRYSYIDYHVNQILWWDYRSWGLGGMNDRMSYLEPAKKHVNILNNLENAYAKYIIMRGFEKRIHYIATGKMPPAKAEEHIQRQANVLNRRMFFNGDTGEIMGSERISAMTDDIFIPQPDGSQPSKIDQLPAGTQVGEVTPLNYFREKIYQALKYPRNRSRMNTQQSPQASIGRPGEIDVEQVVLTRFIENMQASFGKCLIDLFVMFLETRTDYDEKIKDPKLFRVVFEQSNVFKMLKECEVNNLKLDMLLKVKEFITDHSGGPNDIFAEEFVMKEFVKLSDEQYSLNQMLKEKELIKHIRNKERMDEYHKQAKSLEVPEDNANNDMGGSFGGGIGPDLGGGSMGPDLGSPGGEMGGDLGNEPAPEANPTEGAPEELPVPEEK